MKKVALIFSKSINDPTGASAVVRSLVENSHLFAKNGIELFSLTRKGRIGDSRMPSQNSFSVMSFIREKFTAFLRNNSRHSLFVATLNIYFGSMRPAKRIVKQYSGCDRKDDIILVHEIFTCFHVVKRYYQKAKVVFILHTDGDTFKMMRIYYKNIEKTFFYKYLLYIERIVLSNVDEIGFVSESSRMKFLSLHPDFPRNRVSCIYNGISTEGAILQSNEAKTVKKLEICCVGTINERKGQAHIVDALKLLSTRTITSKFHFSIIGDGTLRKTLQQAVLDFKLEEYITFHGTSNRVHEFLKNSHIFILPSSDEGLPIAIIEAMKFSLPIVSTKVGGIPEMLEEGRNGVFIEPSVEGVLGFLEGLPKYDWEKFGKQSYEIFINSFTIDSMIKKYSEILNRN